MASVKQRGSKPSAVLLGGISRVADVAERKRDVLGAVGLLLLSAVFAWQAWAIMSKGWAASKADQVTKWEVHELGEQVATIRQRVQQAVNSATVTAALVPVPAPAGASEWMVQQKPAAGPTVIYADRVEANSYAATTSKKPHWLLSAFSPVQ